MELLDAIAKEVSFTNHEGVHARCLTQGTKMDYSLEAKTMEEVPTINECLKYSLMKYP